MAASLQSGDRWYTVGSAAGLLPGKVRAVSLWGREIAIWRSGSGRFHACDDRCVHRGTRLSIGFVRGDRLVCPYHGWQYGEDGRCSFIPAHPDMTPPANLCLPRFEAAEAGGLLWVSLGEPDASPPDLPGFFYCRSLPVGMAADEVAERASGLRFLPSSLAADADPLRAWICSRRDGPDDSGGLEWSRPGGELVAVDYAVAEPAPDLVAVTAEDEKGGTETRLIVIQPEDEGRSVLHFLTAGPGEVAVLRRETARWVARLRWFLENGAAGVASYNPWGRKARCP